MNIYCIIFMCTFGSNSTDTEISADNYALGGSNSTLRGKVHNETDVALMILPEKGEPVPQFADIVMDLPNDFAQPGTPTRSDFTRNSSQKPKQPIPDSSAERLNPTLSEILLPPSPRKF